MKIRNGFVSNSSSSSFIITSSHSEEEIKKYMQTLLDANNFIEKTNYSLDDICDIYSLDDITEYRYKAYLYYNYNSSLTLQEFKNMKNIESQSGIIIDSKEDNSIPCSIQDNLERLGERFHWG